MRGLEIIGYVSKHDIFKVALSSPTFQPVTRVDSFLGFGMVPSLDLCQTVITEQSRRPATVPTRTKAASGNESKLIKDWGVGFDTLESV